MQVRYQIKGMRCGACAAAVEGLLKKVPGIEQVEVNLLLHQVAITSIQEIPFLELQKLLKEQGYELTKLQKTRRVTLMIEGMRCSACSSALEKVMKQINGVEEVEVNLVMNTAVFSYDSKQVKLHEIINEIKKAGYHAYVKEDIKENQTSKERHLSIYITLVLSILLLYIGMSHMMGSFQLPLPKIIHYEVNPVSFAFVQWILATLILWNGRSFFIHGMKALFHKHPTMDTLVAIGTGSAYGYSLYSFYQLAIGNIHYVHNLYFESAGVVVAFVMFGKHLESLSKKRTTSAIQSLLSLRPSKAILWQDEQEVEVEIEEVHIGDLLVVKAGDHVPLDGEIVEGVSSLDESMLTGESMPIDKQRGDKVIGGTLNVTGRLLVKVEACEEESTLSKIIQMVEDAQAKKAPIARFADKISLIFVPVVLLIAFVAAGYWYFVQRDIAFALTIFVSVLVIACPCALGLATPTAIMVGTGRAAQLGIFIKSGEALENTSYVDTIVFDKTGTLTKGEASVSDILTKEDEAKVLMIASAVEQGSKHPIAKAIVKKAKERQLEVKPFTNLESFHGKGIQAIEKGRKILMGNRNLMEEHMISTSLFQEQEKQLLEMGKTVVWLAIDKEVIALFAIADEIKPEALEVVTALKKQNIDVMMITGDHTICANAIAKQAGIDHVIAQVLPDGKAEHIARLQQEGKRVAMVGDGINDAIALTKSDVGIAIGSGSDIAIESADIVLVNPHLQDILLAIRLSKAVIRNIKQNLFWAFFYNVLGIPIAAGVLYLFQGPLLSPVLAAMAMTLSSISVVSNALRMKKFKK